MQAENFFLERQLRKQLETAQEVTPKLTQTSQLRAEYFGRSEELLLER